MTQILLKSHHPLPLSSSLSQNVMSASLSLSFPPPLATTRAWFHHPTLILTLTRLTPLAHSPLRIDLRRQSRSPTAMSSVHRTQAPLSTPSEELADESDFENIISSNGLVSISGFVSLLSSMMDQTAFSITIFTITLCFLTFDHTVNISLANQREVQGVRFLIWSTSELQDSKVFGKCLLTWLWFTLSVE